MVTNTTNIPATIQVGQLSAASTLTGAEIFFCTQTVGSVTQSVQCTLSQMLALGTVSGVAPFVAASIATNSLIYGNGSAQVGITGFGTTGLSLVGQGSASPPIFTTLGMVGGGTGTTTFTNHGVLIGKGPAPIGVTSNQTAGQLLVGQNVTSDPAWQFIGGDITLTAAGTATIATGAITIPKLSSSVAVLVGFNLGSFTTTSVVATIATAPPPYGMSMPVNMGLQATQATTVLTVSVIAATGVIGATNPVLVPFRNLSLPSGVPSWGILTATSNVTTIVGASLGAASASAAFRYWVALFYTNATTLTPALINCSNSATIFPVPEFQIASTFSLNATSTTAGLFYSNGAALGNSPYRIVGFVEYANGVTTAGTFSTAPTLVQLLGPGVPKPGSVLQVVAPVYGTLASTSFTTVTATTNVTASITLFSPVNLIRYRSGYSVSNPSATAIVTSQLFRGSSAIGNIAKMTGTSGMCVVQGLDYANSSAAISYLVKAASTAGTATIPAANADSASLMLEELMG